MTWLVIAAAAFVGIHLASSSPLRAAVIARFGEAVWMNAFSLASIATIAAMCMAYNRAPIGAPLWDAGVGGRHLSFLLMLIAFLILVPGLVGRNPTAIGQAKGLAAEDPATGILRVTRHPVMWAIGIWGIAHLINNATLADLVFFGSLTGLALVGPMAQDAKLRARYPGDYDRFTATTSYIPFAANITGRQSLWKGLKETRWWPLGLGVAVYAIFLHLHPWLFGVSPLAF